MRKFVIAVLAILTVVVKGEGKSSQPPSNTKHSQHAHSPQSSTSESDGIIVVNQQTPKEQEERPKDQPKSYFERLFTAENTPNLLLFFVGVAGIIVAVFSLNVIKRQTEAIQKQAQSMVNAERAWIMADLEWGSFIGKQLQDDITTLQMKLHYRNEGQAPAWIIDKRIWFRIAGEIEENPIIHLYPASFIDNEPEPLRTGKDYDSDVTVSEPAGQIAAREMEIVRIKGALQRAEELSDDVAAAIERAL